MTDHYAELESALDRAKKNVKTDSYAMSIGELISMYERGELILQPEYQRYFRWDETQKSRLIESILIGLPLPTFFVASNEEGNWEVVDGMQRLSTIFDFMGELSDTQKGAQGYKPFDTLEDSLFYVKEFGDKKWSDFSRRTQLEFKRSKVQITILMRTNHSDVKYEMFQRLNSGTAISPQELRNAILAAKNPNMLQWLDNLAHDECFVQVAVLSEQQKDTRFDMELVLRFFLLLANDFAEIKKHSSVDMFLTHEVRVLAENENFDFAHKEQLFKNTFQTILEEGGKNVFKGGNKHFTLPLFEAIALGIAQNIEKLPSHEILKDKIQHVRHQDVYKEAAKSGANAAFRIPRLLNFGKDYFAG